MPRNIVPKNAMKKKSEVDDAGKTTVYRHGRGAPGGGLGGPHVILVGLRASGKTTVGELAARRLSRAFVDTDQLVQERADKSIEQIVSDDGWDAFRRLETEVLKDVLSHAEPTVVATGGGIVLAEENRELLRAGGPVFYLLATTLLVVDRLTGDMDPATRPPLTELPLTEEMSALREERDPLYMQVANFVLRAEQSPETLAAEIEDKLLMVGR